MLAMILNKTIFDHEILASKLNNKLRESSPVYLPKLAGSKKIIRCNGINTCCLK